MVEEFGGIPVRYGIAPDQKEVLFEMASRALGECDLIVVTAGSSASSRDITSEVIGKLGPPGVLVHGVNVRPGKPTILAACTPEEGSHPKAVIGLPGNPVSALVIARLFLAGYRSVIGYPENGYPACNPGRIVGQPAFSSRKGVIGYQFV
jgi:molybdopterin molybdotransferase